MARRIERASTELESPKPEDVMSVGSRVSWGAIVAGSAVALAILFMLTLLGGAVGLSLGGRVEPENLRIGAVIWAIVTTCASLFVGGLVISQFTVGENKTEAVLYGIIMWAVLFAFLIGLGAAGVSAGFNTLVGMANIAETATKESWEASARRAGIPADQIEQWRGKLKADAEKAVQDVQKPETQAAISEAATRITWYTFLGTWVSMLAAAFGAWVGAGPTFRLFAVREEVREHVPV